MPITTTVAHALRQLLALGLERLDAQLLLLHVLARDADDRAWLIAHDTDLLSPATIALLNAAALRRASGEPLAYITGHKEFFGLDIQVDPRVLIPRPDTETLVEWALELLAPTSHAARVLDLGTGSGAIALALQHARSDLDVLALDFSSGALAVARANAQRLQLPVGFVQGSWMSGLQGKFSLIVSNPPYIASADHHLAALQFEPLTALASGSDGLDDIRTIIGQAPAHLLPGGWLLLEHGYDQANMVRTLLEAAGWKGVQSRRDLSGTERCTGACFDDTDHLVQTTSLTVSC